MALSEPCGLLLILILILILGVTKGATLTGAGPPDGCPSRKGTELAELDGEPPTIPCYPARRDKTPSDADGRAGGGVQALAYACFRCFSQGVGARRNRLAVLVLATNRIGKRIVSCICIIITREESLPELTNNMFFNKHKH